MSGAPWQVASPSCGSFCRAARAATGHPPERGMPQAQSRGGGAERWAPLQVAYGQCAVWDLWDRGRKVPAGPITWARCGGTGRLVQCAPNGLKDTRVLRRVRPWWCPWGGVLSGCAATPGRPAEPLGEKSERGVRQTGRESRPRPRLCASGPGRGLRRWAAGPPTRQLWGASVSLPHLARQLGFAK